MISSNNYAAAKLQGLEKSLSLDQTEYQTGLSILFVGYILMQVPSNMLLNYMSKPSLYLGFLDFCVGISFSSHKSGQDVRRNCRLSIHPWFRW